MKLTFDTFAALTVTGRLAGDMVKPFLEAQKWNQRVFFEDGLARALRITSIPTTIVIDKRGGLVTRMNGFDPEQFVAMLTDRITEALK